MNILVGIDDSPCSVAALEFVKTMPWPRGTKVELLTALQPAVPAYAMPDLSYSSYAVEAAQEQARIQQDLVSRFEREVRDVGFQTHATVVEGDPRTALIEAAKELRTDLLVVGSHGRTGLSKLVLGSVASHVVVHAPCSVLVVKRPNHR
jgi:nucleotide-binding universal stress UspA family protein